MGICICLFSNVDDRTREIDRQMDREKRVDQEIIKLLFLGAGGSGKSTLFKQLRLLHGDGLGEEERRNNTSNIYQNLLDGMKLLVEGNEELHDSDELSPQGVANVTELCDSAIAEYINSLNTTERITAKTAECFKQAWTDPGIIQTWENRSKLQVQDSVKYFMEHIDRIASDGYVPTKDDVLHVRNRTSGIIEENLTIKGRPFLIVDVGGQRSERRKWTNCFDDVTGLIFVASLASYNQLLFEDESTNRMEESLTVFTTTLATPAFKSCCIILFLNKCDLFKEKIGVWPITSCFPNYAGPLTETAQYEFIKEAFIQRNQVRSRKIFVHQTCATDTNHIKTIFDAVNHTIIDQALISAGLIVAAE